MNDNPETTENGPLEANDQEVTEEPTKFKQTFINRFGHIRAGWRFLLYLALTAVIALPLQIFGKSLKNYMPASEGFNSPFIMVNYILINASFILAAYILLRWIDKRPFGSLGLNFSEGWVKELSIGVGIGFGLLTLMFVIFWITGLVEVTAGKMNSVVAVTMFNFLIVFILAGLFEELLIRGYPFQVFIEGSNKWIAMISLSSVFSILHMFNPNFSAAAAVNIFLGGMLISIAYLKTRALWMPTGLHFAWNWTQGPLWGMNVSGIDIENSFLVSTTQGHDLLSGGEFGAEGSLITAVVIAGLCWYLWRAEWLKPSETNAALWRKYPSRYGVEPVDQEM